MAVSPVGKETLARILAQTAITRDEDKNENDSRFVRLPCSILKDEILRYLSPKASVL